MYADCRKELIVERTDRHLHFFSVGYLDLVFVEELLSIVNDEALAVDPEQIGPHGQQPMASSFFGVRCRHYLKWGEVTNVPDNDLVCVVEGEDERTLLDDIDRADGILVTLQPAQVCISEQVLRAPDIRVDFEACGDNHAAKVTHVSKISDASHVFSVESAESFAGFDIVKDNGPIKRACRDTEWTHYLGAVRDEV